MQNYIVYYVDEIRARLNKADISIGAASEAELRSMEEPQLQKLREAALDLNRICELELGRRLPDEDIGWSLTADINGTSFQCYLQCDLPLPFNELVARLITLSGQSGQENGDGYKLSVQFTGTFNGKPFSLYDYKGDDEIHVGGHDELDVTGLLRALNAGIQNTKPTSYVATRHYDDATTHQYP